MPSFNGLHLNIGNLSRLSQHKRARSAPKISTAKRAKAAWQPKALALKPPVNWVRVGKSLPVSMSPQQHGHPGRDRRIRSHPANLADRPPDLLAQVGPPFLLGWRRIALQSKCRWAISSATVGRVRCNVSSLPVAVNPRVASTAIGKCPSAKVPASPLKAWPTMKSGFYYQINYTLTDVPDDAAYFHAQWRRSNPLPYKTDHTLVDGVQGQGHYVGTYLAWGVNNNGWWGEGEIKFFMDGDVEFPTICGTGTEDYFGGAWNFEHPARTIRRLLIALFRDAPGHQTRWALPESAALRHVPLAYHGPDSLPTRFARDHSGPRLASRDGLSALER